MLFQRIAWQAMSAAFFSCLWAAGMCSFAGIGRSTVEVSSAFVFLVNALQQHLLLVLYIFFFCVFLRVFALALAAC